MGVTDTLFSHFPGVTTAQAQIDNLRRSFLSIPATTAQNRGVLNAIRAKVTDANDRDAVDRLLAQADTVDSGFNSTAAQFSYFDNLRRSGASVTDQATAGAALASSANGVLRSSSDLTAKVRPLAAKYGVSMSTAPAASSGLNGGSLAVLVVAGVGVLWLLGRQRRK